jgi:transposase
MEGTMPKIKYTVTLTQAEREELRQITWKGKHRSRKVLNSLILLNCDKGGFQDNPQKDTYIAPILGVSNTRIQNTKKRFVEDGLEIALDGKHKQRVYRREIDGDVEAHIIALSCSEPPMGRSRWSLRLLAAKSVELEYADHISHEAVRRILKKTNSSHGKKKRG